MAITTDAEQRAVKLDSLSIQLSEVLLQLLTQYYNTISNADSIQAVLDLMGTDAEQVLLDYAAAEAEANNRGKFPPTFDPVEYEVQLDGSVTWVEPPESP